MIDYKMIVTTERKDWVIIGIIHSELDGFENVEIPFDAIPDLIENLKKFISVNNCVMPSLPSGDEEIQEFINKSEARRTFQGTPCSAQERLAFDSAVTETIRRLRERGNGA